MNKASITFASSLTKLCEINSSFDTGILKVCYTGKNKNGSDISKQAILRSLKTIYNCPIVCNYDRDSDSIGGHDMEIVKNNEGALRIVNITTPVGVIPESATPYFEEFTEDDGTVNEYLCTPVLLWKRQEAYHKIKNDGITAQSMEITVKDGEIKDGFYRIHDFEFTAFCLLGNCKPCFEGAALEFTKQDFKQQFAEMMHDLKESFRQVCTSTEGDDIHTKNYLTEGGKRALEEKMELVARFGIDIETLDFAIEDFTTEELTEKFESMLAVRNKFALTSNIVDEIYRVLGEVKVEREWGACPRYYYEDCDFESNEVYCWDSNDWLLYGFPYTISGDSISIDFGCKKRKKYVIADFDEGEQVSPLGVVFAEMEQKLREAAELETKYQSASDTIASMETELDELRQFKIDTESAIAKGERDEVFARFEDLVGIEAFENLREKCMEYDIETLEEKCFAIRGRSGASTKFTLKSQTPKLKVEKADMSDEPYGGVFALYGFDK